MAPLHLFTHPQQFSSTASTRRNLHRKKRPLKWNWTWYYIAQQWPFCDYVSYKLKSTFLSVFYAVGLMTGRTSGLSDLSTIVDYGLSWAQGTMYYMGVQIWEGAILRGEGGPKEPSIRWGPDRPIQRHNF